MKRSNSIPTAGGAVPLLGHVPTLIRDPFRFLCSQPSDADLVQVKLGPFAAVMLIDPELTSRVLLDDRTFDKGGIIYARVREVIPNGLVMATFKKHRRIRRACQPAFNNTALAGYADAMRERAVQLTGNWQDGEVIDVVDALNSLAGQVVLSTMFGSVQEAHVIKEMLEDLKAIFRGFRWRLQLGPLRWLSVTTNRRYARGLTRLRQTGIALISERRASGVEHDDLLSMMLARNAEASLTDDEVSDQFIMFFAAGIETTAASVAWALFLLAQHPDVERQLHAEVDAVLRGNPAGRDDIPRLEVTRRVMAETLRIRPPAWISSRTAAVDIDLGRHRVPAGTTIFYSPCTIHHRADLYPDPERFDPDRWIDRDATRPDPGYIPFGVGARKCIGDRFALTEAVLVLATIAGRFRLRPVADGPILPMLSAVLVPRQRLMRLEARHTERTSPRRAEQPLLSTT